MRDFSNFLPPPSRPTLYHPPYLTLKMWYFISRVFEIKFQILLAPLHAFPFTFASKYKIVPPFPSIYSLFPSHFFAFFLFHSSLHIFPILGPPWILLPSYLCTSLSYPIWAADSILWNWTYGLCCFFTPQPPNFAAHRFLFFYSDIICCRGISNKSPIIFACIVLSIWYLIFYSRIWSSLHVLLLWRIEGNRLVFYGKFPDW